MRQTRYQTITGVVMFKAIGGFSAVGVFCLAAVGISALVMRLAVREPDEVMA